MTLEKEINYDSLESQLYGALVPPFTGDSPAYGALNVPNELLIDTSKLGSYDASELLSAVTHDSNTHCSLNVSFDDVIEDLVHSDSATAWRRASLPIIHHPITSFEPPRQNCSSVEELNSPPIVDNDNDYLFPPTTTRTRNNHSSASAKYVPRLSIDFSFLSDSYGDTLSPLFPNKLASPHTDVFTQFFADSCSLSDELMVEQPQPFTTCDNPFFTTANSMPLLPTSNIRHSAVHLPGFLKPPAQKPNRRKSYDCATFTPSYPVTEAQVGTIFPCTHASCEKSFNSIKSLTSHLKCHTLQRLFKCPSCDASFKRLPDMYRHQRSVHQASHPHSCAICGKSFPRADSLKRHMQGKRRGSCYFDSFKFHD